MKDIALCIPGSSLVLTLIEVVDEVAERQGQSCFARGVHSSRTTRITTENKADEKSCVNRLMKVKIPK